MKVFIVLYLSFLSIRLHAQSECDFYLAYCKQDEELCKMHLEVLEATFTEENTYKNLYNLARARYLYTAAALDNEWYNIADTMIIKLHAAANALEKNEIYKAYAYSLKTAAYAFAVVVHKSTILTNGTQSIKYAKLAMQTDSSNAYVLNEYAHYKYHVPAIAGGNKTEAEYYYKKAIAVFENSSKDLSCNWYYINSLLFLAKTYADTNQREKAIETYDKIIRLAPEYEIIPVWKQRLIETYEQ